MWIDSHQHFWKYDPTKDGWITDEMNVLKRDFLPADLEPQLIQNNFSACVAIQADQSESETEFLLELAERHPFIKGVVGWVDLRNDNIEKKLSFYSRHKKLKGFRHIVQSEPDDRFLLGNNFTRGIEMLSSYNYTYDILIYPKQLPTAIEFAEKFPTQKFVIDHIAKPEIRKNKTDNWKKYIEEIAKHKNVYCKVSGMVTEAEWGRWKNEDFTPYLDIAFGAFGVDRIMYGSDWPVTLLSASYQSQLSIILQYIKMLALHDQAKIMGENATTFYNL